MCIWMSLCLPTFVSTVCWAKREPATLLDKLWSVCMQTDYFQCWKHKNWPYCKGCVKTCTHVFNIHCIDFTFPKTLITPKQRNFDAPLFFMIWCLNQFSKKKTKISSIPTACGSGISHSVGMQIIWDEIINRKHTSLSFKL